MEGYSLSPSGIPVGDQWERAGLTGDDDAQRDQGIFVEDFVAPVCGWSGRWL